MPLNGLKTLLHTQQGDQRMVMNQYIFDLTHYKKSRKTTKLYEVNDFISCEILIFDQIT